MEDYLHIDTAGADASPDGALMTRKHPRQTITNYIMVDSVNRFSMKIKKLGGKMIMMRPSVYLPMLASAGAGQLR